MTAVAAGRGKVVATMVGSDVPRSSPSEIEYVIGRLYAAGLELQSARTKTGVPPRKRAMISGELQRIAGLIDEIRTAAGVSSARTA